MGVEAIIPTIWMKSKGPISGTAEIKGEIKSIFLVLLGLNPCNSKSITSDTQTPIRYLINLSKTVYFILANGFI